MGSVDAEPPHLEGPAQEEQPYRFDVKSIAIIGAGPAGLAAAKYLLAHEGAFSRVVIYEQQAEAGGVWNYSPRPSPSSSSSSSRIPQTSPFCEPERPVEGLRAANGGPVFANPMYERLETNTPHTLMAFSDRPFSETVLFPGREEVKAYLEGYADEVRHLIRFSTQVVEVRLRREEAAGGGGHDRWDVRVRDLVAPSSSSSSSAETLETFDAVVVASGHCSVPFVPDYPGLEAFVAAHDHQKTMTITHSKSYRTPGPYAGKRVLVVGNGPSGVDIAAQINTVCAQPLYVSTRSPTTPALREYIGFQEVSPIAQFLADSPERAVRLQDGTVLRNLDAVLFATGYSFSYPFLPRNFPSPDNPLITDGASVHGLYRHFLHARHPTLAFPGLLIKVIPLPFAESQAAILARLWSNDLALRPLDAMQRWEEAEVARKGGRRKFHHLAKGEDGVYINEMHDWAMRTGGGKKGSRGKAAPFWDERMRWERSVFAELKLEFMRTGRTARTVEELGFRYEPGCLDGR